MNTVTRVFALVATASLLAAACADAPPQSSGFEVRDLAPPTSAGSGNGVTTDLPAGTGTATDTGVTLVEQSCFEGEARCGTALVPQVAGSPDLVEVGFRVVREPEGTTGPPVVVLEPGPVTLDASTLPGRAVIAIGSRGQWPGGPAVSCPEWGRLDPEPDATQIEAATLDCTDRLAASGIDLTAFTRERDAADVVAVLTALGISEVDLIAPGLRADLVSILAESTLRVRHVVYVEPSLSGWDPVLEQATEALAAIEAVWARCGELDPCTTPGTVEDFLDAIDALDTRPVRHTRADAPDIDARHLTAAVLRELAEPAGAAFLPRLHQLVLERDADALSTYVDASFSSSTVSGLTIACGRLTSSPADYEGLPERLRRLSVDTHTFLTAVCSQWAAEPQTPLPPPAGIVVASARFVDQHDSLGPTGPLVREPTVGRPSTACVIGVALAWFDREEVDDRECSTPLAMDTRASDPDFVDGRYHYDDDLTVRLQVPESWTDWGAGTWYREADPLDAANLDVYVWFADSPQTAHAEMVDGWGVLDPSYSTRSDGGREWFLAVGSSDTDEGFSYAIAVAAVGNHNVGLVLGADTDEIDALVEGVLVPGLASVDIES